MLKIIKAVDKISVSQKSTYKHLTFPMLYRMLYACGFRINEVLELKLRDIDLEKGIVHLKKLKTTLNALFLCQIL